MTVEIALTRGLVAIVDADMADRVLAMGRWHAAPDHRTVYAAKKDRRADGEWVTLRMHTLITGWAYVDHINGNGLDNRRANLREATNRQNQRNMRRRADNASGFKGVYLDARRGRWQAGIKVDGRKRWLGRFDDPIEAARAYDAAAVHYFGEFARLNFPEVTR